MRAHGLFAVLVLVAGACGWGGEIPAYPNGMEGVKAASVPPPGYYWRNYNVYYHAGQMKDDKGRVMDLDFKLDMAASVQRFLWVTDKLKEYIGADFAVHTCVPVFFEHLKVGKAKIDDERFRMGDVNIAPAILAWHKSRFDLVLAYEMCIPVGDYDRSEAACPGRDYWTHMFEFGGTGYLDKEKTWSFSLLGRYEVETEKRNDHYTPGNQFHFEWGAGKLFPKLGLEVGIAGYCSWQVTDDHGKGAKWDRSVHDRVFAVGPEANYFIKQVDLNVGLRYEKEFGARDRPEGHMTTLTLTKRF